MLFKKALISLLALGIIGGSGAGVYYSVNQGNDQKIRENSVIETVPVSQDEDSGNQQVDAVDSSGGSDIDGRVDDSLEVQNVDQDMQQSTQDLERNPSDKEKLEEIQVPDVGTVNSVNIADNTDLTSLPKVDSPGTAPDPQGTNVDTPLLSKTSDSLTSGTLVVANPKNPTANEGEVSTGERESLEAAPESTEIEVESEVEGSLQGEPENLQETGREGEARRDSVNDLQNK